MSGSIITVIVITFVVAICLALITIHNQSMKKSRSSLLTRLTQLAAANNVKLAETVLLKNCALGTDTRTEKLLIIKTLEDKSFDTTISNFAVLKNCSKKKHTFR